MVVTKGSAGRQQTVFTSVSTSVVKRHKMFGSSVCWSIKNNKKTTGFFLKVSGGEDKISPRLYLSASRPGLMTSLGARAQWEEPSLLPPTSSLLRFYLH